MVDKYGHCIECSKNLVTEVTVNDEKGLRKIRKFTSEHDETEYLLGDGTRMRVCVCKSCKENLDSIDTNKIMDKIYGGWEEELKDLNWSKEEKQKYRDKYYKLKIVSNSENKSQKQVDNEFNRYKNIQKKENK